MPALAPAPSAPSVFATPAPASPPAWPLDPTLFPDQPAANRYQPRVRDVPVDVYLTEGQTGRFMLGGSVNSDLGVMGNITIEERNFDILNFPRRRGDLFNGAFRGAGQNFRLEIVPGNQVQRYTVNWTEPNLFGYSPFSLSVGGFLFSRFYRDWREERLGGRAMIGYEINPNLSISTELRAEDVDIEDPRVAGVPQLDRALGSSDLYTGRVSLIHSTRNSPFLPTEGHFLEMIYDQGFGEFDFPRGQVNYSRYFLIRERADGTGRQTLTSSHKLGFSGADTPIFENFFAGGFSTLRGFRFRGASPVESDVQVGGRFQFIGSLEYMFPITADDMVRMVTFIDYGTIEQDIEFDWKNFRAAPGLGLRIAVPAMGPAPLAFDFAFPVLDAAGDQRQIFNFSMGVTR
jgi:outer membrane protein insertion porin family